MTLDENSSVQKLYPIVNNDDLLEFRIPGNPRGHMQIGKVLLRYVVHIPQANGADQIPENLFGPKQFSSLEIRINGESITRRNCSNEYFLASYFQYLTNFSIDYATTGCETFGIFDAGNIDTAAIKKSPNSWKSLIDRRKGLGGDFKYEIVMPIEFSLFTSNDSLPSSTPIDLSFERASAKLSTVLTTEKETANAVLTIEDPYLIIPYRFDRQLSQLEKVAVSRPLKMAYDDFVINRYNLSKESPNVRLSNILSGPLPPKMFFGLMLMNAYSGDYEKSSTHFQKFDLRKITVYVDGNALPGFPILMEDKCVSIPYVRFLESSNRFLNCYSGQTISQADYLYYHFIQCVSFDNTPTGSVSFDFDFTEAPSEDLLLITCSVFDRNLLIDNYRNCKIE